MIQQGQFLVLQAFLGILWGCGRRASACYAAMPWLGPIRSLTTSNALKNERPVSGELGAPGRIIHFEPVDGRACRYRRWTVVGRMRHRDPRRPFSVNHRQSRARNSVFPVLSHAGQRKRLPL